MQGSLARAGSLAGTRERIRRRMWTFGAWLCLEGDSSPPSPGMVMEVNGSWGRGRS